MSERLRILYITYTWPLGPACGSQQRVLNIGRLLSRFGDVSVVMVQFSAVEDDTVRRTQRAFDVRKIVHPLPSTRGYRLDSLGHRLRYELDPRYLVTDHCRVGDADRNALLKLMQEYDLVWIHKIRTANVFQIDRWPRSILDVDDVPSLYYLSKARSSNNLTRRWLDLRLSWMWRRRERLLTTRFDAMTVCSEEDQRYLGNTSQIHVIPNGFYAPAMRPRVSSDCSRVGFIGNVEYKPNEEGVKWFISSVWPLITHKVPGARLRLVGRGTDGYLSKLGPHITGLGWIEDPGDEIASWSAMIVPVKFGGGTRVKIAEGFARKCPVVSTTVGAFGYEVKDGQEILLADAADDFALACVHLLNSPQLRDNIAERAHTLFSQRLNWDSFEGSIGTALRECLTNNNRLRSVGTADLSR